MSSIKVTALIEMEIDQNGSENNLSLADRIACTKHLVQQTIENSFPSGVDIEFMELMPTHLEVYDSPQRQINLLL